MSKEIEYIVSEEWARRTAGERVLGWIERQSFTGRDPEGCLFLSMGPTRERLQEIARTDPLWARWLDGDR